MRPCGSLKRSTRSFCVLSKSEANAALILLSLARHGPGAVVGSVPGTASDGLYGNLVEIGWLQFEKHHEKPALLPAFGLTNYGRTDLLDLLV